MEREECEVCTTILNVFTGDAGRSVPLVPVPRLLAGDVCVVHEKIFQQVAELEQQIWESSGQSRLRPNEDLHVQKSDSGIVSFVWMHDGGTTRSIKWELLLTRVRGNPINGSLGRAIDRNWIDPELIRSWKRSCEEHHGAKCTAHQPSYLQRPTLPWLIDAVENRLVSASDEPAYVALSYVWGGTDMLKTTRQNLKTLCEPGALLRQTLPRTIRDAIGVVRLLGERYLWVDSLCVVQDDSKVLRYLISHMAAVYANATLTIVAADGSDAEFGLRGLQGLSASRDNPCVLDWPGGTSMNWPSARGLDDTTWNSRGWTFQEYVFSRRRLIFVADTVRWECREACYCEEHTECNILPTDERSSRWEHDNTAIRRTSLDRVAFPDMVAYGAFASCYVQRQLTYSEDMLDALAGVLSALLPIFSGGFIWGLPVVFLDICLLWRASDVNAEPETRRRWSPLTTANSARHAPTWSWTSLQGYLQQQVEYSEWRNEDWVMFSPDEWFYNIDPIRRIIPLVQWHVTDSKQSLPKSIPRQNEWHKQKRRYLSSNAQEQELPPGWTRTEIDFQSATTYSLCSTMQGSAHLLDKSRDKYPPRSYYTHETLGSVKFCYPLPLKEENPVTPPTGRYLCCSAERATFDLKPSKDYIHRHQLFSQQPPDGNTPDSKPDAPHGVMFLDEPLYSIDAKEDESEPDSADESKDETGYTFPVELVAISMTYRASKRWKEPMGEENPQFYNVLWVEWINDVAYRKGVGRVDRTAWETSQREKIDLILG